MRCIIADFRLAGWILVLVCNQAVAATVYSRANGIWGNTAVWSYTPGGPSCGCIPASSDNIIINHSITLDRSLNNVTGTNGITGTLTINAGASLSGGGTYDVDIRAGGTLNLCGTLVVRDMTFSNGSFVNVCPTGVLTVNGNFENKNNSDNVVINGSMTVGGSYTNGNGGVISGSGSVVITNGPVTNTGTSFGCPGGGCAVFPCQFSEGNCGGIPLPINLIAFDADCNAAGTITLRWTTASEVNNDHFTVERSTDGMHFIIAGNLPGAGTTSQLHKYQWTDETAPGAGFYYRLRQTDYDGQYSRSKPIFATCLKKEKSMIIYPNPAYGTVFISGLSFSGEAMFILSDAIGKKVMEQKITTSSDVQLDLSGLTNGVYFIGFYDAGEFQGEKLILSR